MNWLFSSIPSNKLFCFDFKTKYCIEYSKHLSFLCCLQNVKHIAATIKWLCFISASITGYSFFLTKMSQTNTSHFCTTKTSFIVVFIVRKNNSIIITNKWRRCCCCCFCCCCCCWCYLRLFSSFRAIITFISSHFGLHNWLSLKVDWRRLIEK